MTLLGPSAPGMAFMMKKKKYKFNGSTATSTANAGQDCCRRSLQSTAGGIIRSWFALFAL